MIESLTSDTLRSEIEKIWANVKKDSYLSWLLSTTGGWLVPGHPNLVALDFAIRYMPMVGAMIEIGTYLGQSTNVMTYLMWKYRRFLPLFCCDPWMFEKTGEPVGGFFDGGTNAYREYCMKVCRQTIAMFSAHHMPHVIEAFSHDFFADWSGEKEKVDMHGRSVKLGGPISFAYIDGAHTYEGAREDFSGIHPFLVPGGFVFFDDSTPDWEGVHRVVNEVMQHPEYELLFTTPNYFFRKRPAIIA